MNKTIWVALVFCTICAGTSLNAEDRPEETVEYPVFENVRGHENIEWSGAYAFNLTDGKKDLPRVLLVGDSICVAYQEPLRNLLDGKMTVSYWVSSYCLTSPGYLQQLSFYLDEAKYSVVHFNNGCHSFSAKGEDWEKGLRAAFKMIRIKQPQAKIIWATTTPNKDANNNAKVVALNAIAAKVVADTKGIAVDDLFALMNPLDRALYWKDNYHFTTEAVNMQARQIADVCLKTEDDTGSVPVVSVE